MKHDDILNLPKGWEIKTLGEVCEIEYGTRVVRKRDGGTIYPVYGGGGATFFMDISNRENRLVIARFAMSEKCTRSIKGRFFLNDSGLTTRIKNSKEILQEFLDLQFFYLNNIIYSLARGSAQKNLNMVAFKNIKIHYPKSLTEQKAIVKKLDACFVQITQAKANLEQNLQNAKDLFQSTLSQIFNNQGKDWSIKTLGDSDTVEIIDGDRGKNYPTKTDFLEQGFCLFMNTKNVRPNGFKFDVTMFISEEKDKAMGKGKLKRNDVIMTTRGTIGNLGIYNDDVKYKNIRINSGMLIFRPNQKQIITQYLFELFRSDIIKSQIKKHVSGAAQPQLPIKTLVNFKIPIPPLAKQKAIVKKLDTLNKQTQTLEQNYQNQLKSLLELKQSLLEKAFCGELAL